MTTNAKIAIGILVAVLIVLGLWFWYASQQPTNPGSQDSSAETTTLPSGSNTSDTALSQDLNSIDAQMQGVSSDNAEVNTSVSEAASQ